VTSDAHDSLPFTVLLPETAAEPILCLDDHAALRLAVVERSGAALIGGEWDRPGVYILLDPPDPKGQWGCYVGKAPAGIRTRLRHHLRHKEHWHRALLVQRDTTRGFHSAQVGWLEGRLYDLLNAAEDAQLHNGNRPSDETLPSYERTMLEASVMPISRLMRLIGYDPATADDTGMVATISGAKKTSKFFGITLKQVMDAGHLAAGSVLSSTNGSHPATAHALAGGRIEFDGQAYDTPSAAAVAVKHGPANGWDFWALETSTGRVTLATLRARYLEGPPPKPQHATPSTRDPGQEWLDRMIEEEPAARERFSPGDVFEPHDGHTSDLNLHYADLVAEPNPALDPTRPGYVRPSRGPNPFLPTPDEPPAPERHEPPSDGVESRLFRVRGYVNGVVYALDADPGSDHGEDGIVVACSPRTALELVRSHIGESADLAHPGPTVTISLTDPGGLIAGLHAFTEVVAVEGNIPNGVYHTDDPGDLVDH
jgi:hypothetical protein